MRIVPLKTIIVDPIIMPSDRERFEALCKVHERAAAEARAAGQEPPEAPKLPEPEKFIYAERLFLIITADFQKRSGPFDEMLRLNKLQNLLRKAWEKDAKELRLEDIDWNHIRAALDRYEHRAGWDCWVQFFEDMKDPPKKDVNAAEPEKPEAPQAPRGRPKKR